MNNFSDKHYVYLRANNIFCILKPGITGNITSRNKSYNNPTNYTLRAFGSSAHLDTSLIYQSEYINATKKSFTDFKNKCKEICRKYDGRNFIHHSKE